MARVMQLKLSCHIITYNHKEFIRQCLDGAINQITNFDYEIIVGDDLSNDGTRDILIDYANKYPEKIKLNLREKRGTGVPGKENFLTTLEFCTGEFISLCDGDDYWTDPLKLQKQVDFLEENFSYSGCIHDAIIIGENIKPSKFTEWNKSKKVREDIIFERGGGFYPTASLVFRNPPNRAEFIEFIKSFFAGDSAIAFYLLKYGSFWYINEAMCVYRMHDGGVYSSRLADPAGLLEIELSNLQLLKSAKKHIKRYFSEIDHGITICMQKIAAHSFKLNSVYYVAKASALVIKNARTLRPGFGLKNFGRDVLHFTRKKIGSVFSGNDRS